MEKLYEMHSSPNIVRIMKSKWAGWLSQYSDWLRAGRSGDRFLAGARFSATVQTGPGAHPGTGSFREVKRPGRGVDHPPLLAPRVTLSLLMSYIYMELLVKPEILTSYICGPTFGNAESRLFLFAAQCFNTELMQRVILWHSCV
jgi:hypothetical protein